MLFTVPCAVFQPYLRRMMTRKWLTTNEDFKQLQRRTELLLQHCNLMRPPHAQVRRRRRRMRRRRRRRRRRWAGKALTGIPALFNNCVEFTMKIILTGKAAAW